MKISTLDTKTVVFSSNKVLYIALPYTTMGIETAGKILTEFPNNLGTDTVSLSTYDRQMLQ
jgi:hypothetical protein